MTTTKYDQKDVTGYIILNLCIQQVFEVYSVMMKQLVRVIRAPQISVGQVFQLFLKKKGHS